MSVIPTKSGEVKLPTSESADVWYHVMSALLVESFVGLTTGTIIICSLIIIAKFAFSSFLSSWKKVNKNRQWLFLKL